MDAIIQFFPSAIDNLGREMGIVDGTLPVIFEGFDNDSDLKLESFLFGAGDTTMEFGEYGVNEVWKGRYRISSLTMLSYRC